MKKEKNVWAIASLIAFWWLAPNKINAQQDSVSVTSLNEVVITATKFAKSQSETGKVLTIINEADLAKSSGKDLAQVLNEQAGLFINGATSSPGKDKSVFLRGAKGEYTVILLDGIPLNDPSSIGGGAYDLRMIPVDQIERIEILKGNQSTLYGSNAIAGVINIITKKDGDKKFGGAGTLGYGSFNSLRGSLNISGGTEMLDYSIGASHYSTDGFSEAAERAGDNFEKDEAKQNGFHANATFKPVNQLSIQPYFRFSDFNGTYDSGPFQDNPGNEYRSSFQNYGTIVDYKLNKGKLHGYYGFDKTNRVFVDASFGAPVSYPYYGRFHHGELFFNYDVANNIQLLSGLSWQKLKMLDESAVERNPSTALISPYASLFLKNWNGFSAELGGRLNHHSQYGDNFTFSFNPSYMIQEKAKLFFNLSSGFKAPSLQQLYGQFGANPDLKPEKSESMELGTQIFFQQKGDVRVVGFTRNIRDLIFYAYPDGYINQRKQLDKGFDVEGSWRFHSKVRLKLFYSYVDGKTKQNSTETLKVLYRIPKHSLGLNVAYSPLANWTTSINYKLVGNRKDLFYNSNTFLNEEVDLDSYHLLDFYTDYSFLKGKLKVFVDAKNILNQKYYEVYGYSPLPASVNVGASVRW
jgi:vitamin B12 transporter